MTTVVTDYATRLANLPPDTFVAVLLWFSISGNVERADGQRATVPVRVTHDQMEELSIPATRSSEQLPDLVAKGAGAKRREPPHLVLIDVGQSAVRKLVLQLIQPGPRLINMRVEPGQPDVGERFVPDGDPEPVDYPSEIVICFEPSSVAVGGQRLDPGEEGVELE